MYTMYTAGFRLQARKNCTVINVFGTFINATFPLGLYLCDLVCLYRLNRFVSVLSKTITDPWISCSGDSCPSSRRGSSERSPIVSPGVGCRGIGSTRGRLSCSTGSPSSRTCRRPKWLAPMGFRTPTCKTQSGSRISNQIRSEFFVKIRFGLGVPWSPPIAPEPCREGRFRFQSARKNNRQVTGRRWC